MFVHKHYSQEDLVSSTNCVQHLSQDLWDKHVQSILKLKPCVIHVIEGTETSAEEKLEAMQEIMKLSKTMANKCLLNAIFYKVRIKFHFHCLSILVVIKSTFHSKCNSMSDVWIPWS